MSSRDELLNQLANYNEWDGLSRERLIPLLESAELVTFADGQFVFRQFYPSSDFYLLGSGVALHSGTTESRQDVVPFGPSNAPFAALGWSGFLPPHRYGTSVKASGELSLLRWSQDKLAQLFYSDPPLAIRFFDLVLNSVRQQLVELRQHRVREASLFVEPPVHEPLRTPRPVVGNAENCLRQSAFFGAFDEDAVTALAGSAEIESFEPGQRIVRQDATVDGLLLIAAGRCNIYFEHDDAGDLRLLPFRRFYNRVGIIAGVPVSNGEYVAEASVFAESHCWIYRLPAQALGVATAADPEFGRMFQQRMLARLAGLIGAVRVVHDASSPDAEVNAVAGMIANSQARLPVTSDLHKLPHLLRNRLTVGNAFAVLRHVSATGRYHERAMAEQCNELLANLAAENAFYREILVAVDAVIGADESMPAADVRSLCDEHVDAAFDYLDCRILGEENLPKAGGNIFVLNHLSCPEYYELPNYYHFSFDTAFVSRIVWKHFGASAIRVVRQSPGAEFGHNLFYKRLEHITVPTLESGLDEIDPQEFARQRRAAGELMAKQGKQALARGHNLVICPEGQSQPVERSPARFHSGAFRLALASGARVVPVALAGFHRRYKDGPLVAVIGPPVNPQRELGDADPAELRAWIEQFHGRFATSVVAANTIAAEPARLNHP